MAVPRLLVALGDLATMAAPLVGALVLVAATLLFWPGAIVGVPVLLLVGWYCKNQTIRIKSEHHW